MFAAADDLPDQRLQLPAAFHQVGGQVVEQIGVRGPLALGSGVLQAARDVGIRKIVLLSSECATGVLRITDGPRSSPDYLPIDEAHPLAVEPIAEQVAKLTLPDTQPGKR